MVIHTKEETYMTKYQTKQVLIERIQQLLDEREMSLYALSYKATLPLSTLAHIMDGSVQNPGVFTVMKICDGLGMTMKEFFDTPEFDELMSECE